MWTITLKPRGRGNWRTYSIRIDAELDLEDTIAINGRTYRVVAVQPSEAS